MTEPKLDYNLVASEFRRILNIAEATEPFTVESDAAYKRLGLFCSAYGDDIERGVMDIRRIDWLEVRAKDTESGYWINISGDETIRESVDADMELYDGA